MKFLISLILFVLFAISCNNQYKQVYPTEEWQTDVPENQGIDSKKMLEAMDYLESESKYNGNREVVIIRNGYMVYAGENIDSVHNIFSCSKTFTSTVLGLLVEDGLITLDDKTADYEPLLVEYYPDVTFRHFATMTSGYSASGKSRSTTLISADWSWSVYEPEEPMFEPGTAFAYWDEAQMMFGRVLTQVLKCSMHDFLKERITDDIGMGDWNWYPEQGLASNGATINNGCTGVYINAKQFARWGWLFMNEGNWDGKQLLSREWVRQASSVQVPVSIPVADTDRKSVIGPGSYGFNWWINGRKANGNMKLPGAPEDCYYAQGLKNNKCIVIPQWKMVIVRMGLDGHPEKMDEVYGTFLHLMSKAIIN
jgi:CubicO group peptidase (beta-lactamase class C family)